MKEKQIRSLKYMGIDVEDAAEHFSGSVSRYEEQLKEFVKDSKAMLDNLEQELSKEDRQGALCLLHDLKAQTKRLGLFPLYTLFEELYGKLEKGSEAVNGVDDFTKKCCKKIVQQITEILD